MMGSNIRGNKERATSTKKLAITYYRVSDPRQVDNYSLDTQRAACWEYAERNNVEIIKEFREEGESAKTDQRTQWQKAVKYLAENHNNIDVFLAYKQNRLARSSYDYQTFKRKMKKYGVKVETTVEGYGDDPEGELMGSITAAFDQYENEKKAEAARVGMLHGLKEGRWMFPAPVGYENGRDILGKAILIPSKDSELVVRAFELMKTGLYKQSDVREILLKEGFNISRRGMHELLRRPIYAGILEHKSLDEPVRSLSEPLISKEDYHRVQDILAGIRLSVPPKNRNNPDYPLRRFIRCPYCDTPLTGSSPKGRSRKYKYYHCRTKGCHFGNVPTSFMEQRFIEELRLIQPKENIVDLFCQIVREIWKEKQNGRMANKKKMEQQISQQKEKKKKARDLYVEGKLDEADYNEIKNETDEKINVLRIELVGLNPELKNISECLDYCRYFLINLADLWLKGDLGLRQRFQNLIFPNGIYYMEDGSFGTTEISVVFQLLGQNRMEKFQMVAPNAP